MRLTAAFAGRLRYCAQFRQHDREPASCPSKLRASRRYEKHDRELAGCPSRLPSRLGVSRARGHYKRGEERSFGRSTKARGAQKACIGDLRMTPFGAALSTKCARTAAWKAALRNKIGIAVAFALLGFVTCGGAQTVPTVDPRINAPVDDTIRTTLTGNTHPLARPQYDRGAVPDSQPLHRMLLLLKRSADQEAALKALLDQQQNQSSPNYHRWLTPQEFGQQFGPADSDIQAVSGWLQSHGFQIARVSAGKNLIEFSGNARQVREAFQTEIHRYVVDGQEHYANASDPQIPTALAPIVAGTVSLHNFPKKAQSHIVGAFSRSKSTGVVKTLKSARELRGEHAPGSEFTFPSGLCPVNNTCFALGPTDFATIYNVSPLAPAITGAGQTIAIVGDSEICTAMSPDFGNLFVGPLGNTVICNSDDVANFRSLFGLPANLPLITVDGPDPGFNMDETEGDLDVEWAGAIAPNATINFVIAEDTETSAGVDLAAAYAVDNNLAPVLSESFGACEEFLGSTNQFYSNLWEQAAAQGITVVVASGDSGSAGCDFPGPFAALFGLAVNGIASTPFNVAAGGTDFDVTAANYASTYWNNTNGAGEASAKSYIPETPWNDSCAQNFTGSAAACDFPTLLGLDAVGGGGGESSCANSIGACSGGYPKPAWQSGPYVTGMASTDGVRDLPDISFFAADGAISGSFYIVCESDLDTSDAPCSLSSTSVFTTFIGIGGTSSAAPAFAGVMALVNQKESMVSGPKRQGNANYVLYALANAQQKQGLNCNSTTGPVSGCPFNDVTRGNNSVPCYSEMTNCASTNPNPYGVLEPTDTTGKLTGTIAYNAGTGYDLATGLGTINVANLVANWASVAGKFSGTTTTLKMCAPPATPCSSTSAITITHGDAIGIAATVAPVPPGSGTPTGDVALIGTDSKGQQRGIGFAMLSSGGTVSTQLSDLPGGTYTVTAHYAGDGDFGVSDSNAINVTIGPEATTTTLTAPVINFVNGKTIQNGGTIAFGDVVYLRADVAGLSHQGKATGSVTFKDGTTTLGNPVPLNAEGYAELQMGASVFGAPLTSLAVGSHNITANYSGDASFSGSVSSSLTINVTPAPTTITLQASAINIPPSSSVTVSPGTTTEVNAFIDTQVISNPAGGSFGDPLKGTELQGTVTFTAGGTTLGTSLAVPANASVDSNGFIAARVNFDFTPNTEENLTISATFTPSNANFQASSSTSMARVTVAKNEGFTIKPGVVINCLGQETGTCIFVPAAGQTGTSPVTVTSIGLSGTVTLTCTVIPTNAADLQVPSCSFTLNGATNSTVSLTGNGSTGQRMLTITTTARSVSAAPAIRTQGPDWFLAGVILSLGGCSFLLLTVRTRKLSPAIVFVLLLVLVAGLGFGCAGSSSPVNNPANNSGTSSAGSSGTSGSGGGTGGGGTGGGGATSNPGTTADIYTVSVTATPSVGTAIQTQFLVFLQ